MAPCAMARRLRSSASAGKAATSWRAYGGDIIDTIEMGHVKSCFADAAEIGRVLDLYAEGAVRCRHDLLRQVQIGDDAGSDSAASDPRADWKRAGRRQALWAGAVYDYEPDEAEILAELLPRNVSVQIFRALLENAASEQGARMTAMDRQPAMRAK